MSWRFEKGGVSIRLLVLFIELFCHPCPRQPQKYAAANPLILCVPACVPCFCAPAHWRIDPRGQPSSTQSTVIASHALLRSSWPLSCQKLRPMLFCERQHLPANDSVRLTRHDWSMSSPSQAPGTDCGHTKSGIGKS